MKPEAILEVFGTTLVQCCKVRRQDHGIIGVSGGGDSIALLVLLRWIARALDLRLTVVSIDHGLRPEAVEEVTFVGELSRDLGLRFVSRTVDARGRALRDRRGLEEAARLERHEALERIRREGRAAWIALGHSLSDQAETVLLRIGRGTGLAGLGAMAFRRGLVIRPLLDLRRQDLRSFLRHEGLSWREDPSNRDRRIERVGVRQDLLPLVDEIALGDLAREARAARAMMERTETAWLARHSLRSDDLIVWEGAPLQELADPLISLLIRRALPRTGGHLELWRPAMEELVSLAKGSGPRGLDVPRWRFRSLRGARGSLLAWRRSPPSRSAEVNVSGPGCHRLSGLDVWLVIGGERPCSPLWGRVPADQGFVVRARRPGDRLLGSRHKLKKLWDRLGVWRHLRDRIPVIARGDEVFWTAAEPKRPAEGILVCFVVARSHPIRQWLRAHHTAGESIIEPSEKRFP